MGNMDNYTKINFLLTFTKTDKLIEYIGENRRTINQLEHTLQRELEPKIQNEMISKYSDYKGRIVLTDVVNGKIEGQYHTHCAVKLSDEARVKEILEAELERITGVDASVNANLNCFL